MAARLGTVIQASIWTNNTSTSMSGGAVLTVTFLVSLTVVSHDYDV